MISTVTRYHDPWFTTLSAATLGRAGSSSGFAVSLPTSLCCPGPAPADRLAPDLLILCNGDYSGAALAIAPHPDVHLIEPVAVALVLLRVCTGASKTRP
jgi:hypothetical protein